MIHEEKSFDVIIIGGSYAGLSAAMALGRSVRNILVIDSGNPCNRQTPHAHNFITQDGQPPAAITQAAKQQVLLYPTVSFAQDTVTAISGVNTDFQIETASGQAFQAKKVLFATGIKDIMPEIPGFSECWGISVIHCPYCHGYEVRGQKTGILTQDETAVEFGRLIKNWTKDVTIFTNGAATFDQALTTALNIEVIDREISQISHQNGQIESLEFRDGSSFPLDALYARLKFRQHSDLPRYLGCQITEEGFIEVDAFQKTSIPGIYAAGDNSNWLRAVSVATAAGTKAGAFINHELIQENF